MADAKKVIAETCENICDKYCKFTATIDENNECEYMKEHSGSCYLDDLMSLIEE